MRQQLTIKFLRDFSFTEYKFTQKMKKSVLIKTLQKEFLLSCCNGECSFVPNNWQHLAWDQKLTMHFINHIVICKTKDRCIKRWVSDHWKHQNSMVSIKIDNLFMFCHLHMHTFHFYHKPFFRSIGVFNFFCHVWGFPSCKNIWYGKIVYTCTAK